MLLDAAKRGCVLRLGRRMNKSKPDLTRNVKPITLSPERRCPRPQSMPGSLCQTVLRLHQKHEFYTKTVRLSSRGIRPRGKVDRHQPEAKIGFRTNPKKCPVTRKGGSLVPTF